VVRWYCCEVGFGVQGTGSSIGVSNSTVSSILVD
jgi:hypothetical protein